MPSCSPLWTEWATALRTRKRITEAESRISKGEDRTMSLENRVAELEQKVKFLPDRTEDSENRSRGENIRVTSLKDGTVGRHAIIVLTRI